jgi:hypothetical protein
MSEKIVIFSAQNNVVTWGVRIYSSVAFQTGGEIKKEEKLRCSELKKLFVHVNTFYIQTHILDPNQFVELATTFVIPGANPKTTEQLGHCMY